MENSNKVSNQQIQAKKYIEEHDIEKTVSEMLNSLVHEKSKQPLVYMIKYLAGLLTEEERKQNGLVIPEPYPKGKPIVKFPELEKSNSILKRHLTRNLWSIIKYNKTKYGGNIMNILKLAENSPDNKIGCIITDGDCIQTFASLLNPIINEADNLSENKTSEYPLPPLNPVGVFPHNDRIAERVTTVRIAYSRNLSDTAFTSIISADKRTQVENAITKSINALVNDKIIKEGKYLSIKDNEEEIRDIFKNFKNYDYEAVDDYMKHAELKNAWPDNRSVFVTEDKDVVILINFVDHFKIVFNFADANFSVMYSNVCNIVKAFEKYINFNYDKIYGYLTTDPSLIGAGLEVFSEIKLKNATTEYKNLIENMKFDAVAFNSNENLATKANFKLSFGTELEFFEDYYNKIAGLINIDIDSLKLDFNKLEIESDDPYVKEAYEILFEDFKYVISASGNNLNSLLKNNKSNFVLADATEYKTFFKFIQKYVKLSQNFDITELDHIHRPDDSKNNTVIAPQGKEKKLISTQVLLIRNINDYPFPTCKINTEDNNKKFVEFVKTSLQGLNTKNVGSGKFISLSDPETWKLIDEKNIHLSFRNANESNVNNDIGIILFDQDNIYGIVNDTNHFILQLNTTDEFLHQNFIKILKLSNEFARFFKYTYDKKLGFLTSSPKYVGTGLSIRTLLKLPNLVKNETLLNEILSNSSFNYKIFQSSSHNTDEILELTNKYTIGRSETEILSNLIYVINQLIENDNKE